MDQVRQGKMGLFLATTAREDFWDTSKHILFLGDWCLRYSRRGHWGSLNGEVLPGAWQKTADLHAAYRHLGDVYEEILPRLAQKLNALHDVYHSDRYWRIVLGPWLFHYIHFLYDRYTSIRRALDTHPAITTVGLAESCYSVPRNTRDFIRLVVDDPYNLQGYTKIFDALGMDIPRKTLDPAKMQPSFQRTTTLQQVWQKAAKLFFGAHQIILCEPYFDRVEELKMIVNSLGTIWPYVAGADDMPLLPIDVDMRKRLLIQMSETDEFSKVIVKMLPTDMPQCYLETFKRISETVRTESPGIPRAIFSAVSWYFDEHFKQWAAGSSEKGTRLMGIQHGGNYGSPLFMAVEDHELAITDKFYSWGWKRSDCFSEVVAMPSAKLSSKKPLGADGKKEGILFVGSVVPRYLHRFTYLSNCQFTDYLRWQTRFVDSLPVLARNVLTFRPHREDYGWDIRQRWKDSHPELIIEGWHVPFIQSLKNCRIFVCDHLSTTFAEALAMNKPSIFFWDPQVNELREEAKPFYDTLRNSGILHDTPEQAAKAVDTAYDAIEVWWNEPERQAARKFFCDRFAQMSSHAYRVWIGELRRSIKIHDTHH